MGPLVERHVVAPARHTVIVSFGHLLRMARGQTGRRILKNASALWLVQFASYIVPLLVVPYTASVLGVENFGRVAFIQGVVGYSVMVTNYGFSFSAARRAALLRDNPRELACLVAQVWGAKLALMLACLLTSLVVFAFASSLRPYLLAYLFGFVVVVGAVFQADWLFQGLEDMKWVTIANVVPKLALTPLIFVLVRRPSDYAWLLLLQSAVFLTSGVCSAWLAVRRLRCSLPRPSLSGVINQLKEGTPTFMASAAINLYTGSNVVLLGLLTNTAVVGYYSAAQKLMAAFLSLWTPLCQALYPYFCSGFGRCADETRNRVVHTARIVGIISLAGAVTACIIAPGAVPRYLGERFRPSVPILQVLVFSLPAIVVSNVLGIQGLLAAGLYHEFLKVVCLAAALNVAVAPLSILAYGGIGLAAVNVAIESWICVHQALVLGKRRRVPVCAIG